MWCVVQLREQRAENVHLKGEIERLRSENATAEESRKTHFDREVQLETALANLQARVASPNAKAEEELEGWLNRVSSLRSYLDRHPQYAIPEMKRLRALDWLDATKEAPMATEADLRLALAKLRASAKNLVRASIAAALKQSTAANNGQAPVDLQSIIMNLPDPADAEILKRYELNPPGEIKGLQRMGPQGAGGVKAILMEKPVDPLWDSRSFYTIDGPGTMSIDESTSRTVQDAMKAYRAANGSEPLSSSAISEFLNKKINPEVQAELFEALRTPIRSDRAAP